MTTTTVPKKKLRVRKPDEKRWGQVVLHITFVILCLCYILPLMMAITISLSPASDINTTGFMIFPKNIDFSTYKQIFENPTEILTGYKNTIFFTVVNVFLSIIVQSTCAYALSRKDYAFRMPITFLLFFTTLFGGGMVPSYILMTKYLHLNDTIWVYIIPSLVSVWNIIVLRTNFQGIPDSLIEAAVIDGAGEWRICFTIILPLSTPAIASIGFLMFIGKWNDWMTCDMYIRDMNLYSLQFLLQRLLNQAEYAKQLAQKGMHMVQEQTDIPTEAFRFAMAIVAMGPAILVFPFFQKYFAKGLTLGSVKG